ncbi:MAG: methyl-accepting chemotaxis protein [Lachnospiraceae bacterium]|nr:methyl-accepting chemotaxis protein [Lachnospiraceae bacterium]
MKTIKTKIMACIVGCSLITALIVGALSIGSTAKITESEAVKNMNYIGDSAANSIDATITRIETSVNILADVVVDKLDENAFFTDKNYADGFTDSILDEVFKFSERTEGAITSYIRYNPEYSNPTSGCFLTRDSLSDPFTAVTPTDFSMYESGDLEHVGWYYIPVQNGAPIWMDPYLNSNINVYMISYVVPIYDSKGTSIGIVGMDIAVTQITDMVDSVKLFDSGYAFLTKADGEVLHHNSIDIGSPLSDADASLNGVNAYISAEDNDESFEYSYQGVDKMLVVNTLHNGMKLILAAPKNEIYSETYSLLFTIIGIVLLALVISAVIGFFVSNGLVVNPIKSLTGVINRTARLDLTRTDGADKLVGHKDEIGKMAGEVQVMRASFRAMVDSLADVEKTINGAIEDLDGIMKDNNQKTDENSEATQELAAGMQEASANTQQIVSNVSEVRSQTMEIFDLAIQSESESKNILARADDMQGRSNESSDKTHHMYELMKEKSREAVERSQAVSKIHELTDDIKNISSQTNLLALNANIEAARAGDAGRGFAVVAGEIGSLAAETLNTVDNIGRIVEEVNDAVGSMNECIRELMSFLEETVLADYVMFRDMGEGYRKDADYFINIISQVRGAVESLEKNVEEIVSASDEINNMTTNSADSVNDIAMRSDDMRNANDLGYSKLQDARAAMDMLVEITGEFKIE